MKTYKITLELVLKDTAELWRDDFVERCIAEQLEAGEFINAYDYEEVQP